MKDILELRKEAIEEDKNSEFYLYQLLEEEHNVLNEAIELLNTYITNEKSNINSDYYLIDMFEKILSILKKGKEKVE